MRIQSAKDSAMRRTRLRIGRSTMLVSAVGAALMTGPASPQRAGGDDATTDCINLRDIDRTRVVDEDTLLFYMRGGEVYRNDLPNRCPNLDFDQRFMYRVQQNRLCNTDIITVIDDIGFGFTPGASCGLGKFHAIDEEQADELAERSRGRGAR